MSEVGFEPTPPKRLQLKCSALDHSAIQTFTNYYKNEILTLFYNFAVSN